ncbi:MAG TPA: hypothetical protein VF753_17135 [Terriglobales bacterium]
MSNAARIIIILILTQICWAETHGFPGPNTLGPFRIDRDAAIKTLFDDLGTPVSTNADAFCYKSSDGKSFLVLSRMTEVYGRDVAGSATLSAFPNCINEPVTVAKVDLAQWTAGDSIGLGSTAESVLREYGKPSREDRIEGAKYRWIIHGDRDPTGRYTQKDRPEIGDRVLVYKGAPNDLRIAEFGIRAGKVAWIFLSRNE